MGVGAGDVVRGSPLLVLVIVWDQRVGVLVTIREPLKREIVSELTAVDASPGVVVAVGDSMGPKVKVFIGVCVLAMLVSATTVGVDP